MGFFRLLTIFVVLLALLVQFFPDYIILFMPMYYDAYFIRALYPKDLTNTGATSLPLVTRVIPKNLTLDQIEQIFDPHGYPTHVKNVLQVDKKKILDIMTKGNAGRMMRMLSYENVTDAHFSSSCGCFRIPVSTSFDEYANNHLFNEENHSWLYAGFESITEPETIKEISGLDVTKLGDYRQNNLFTSNFPTEIMSAPLHCAPIDSLTLQLIGTKTWYMVSPEELATVPNTPMPTFFNFPYTDDQLLSRFKNIHIVKQGPGDAFYFGPGWCHAVSTSAGPNLMLNMRYNNLELIKKGPSSLAFKLFVRKFTRTIGGLPQDNKDNYPLIYEDLNGYYDNCGPSKDFNKLWKEVQAMPW